MKPAPSLATRPGAVTLFGRALRRRCPNCGGRPIFSRWIHMADRCPSCGLVLSRKESGYSLGGFWLNMLFAEGVTVALLVITLVRTWPDPPWDLLQYGLPALALLTPVLFFPFSKTLFLALDLMARPSAHYEHD